MSKRKRDPTFAISEKTTLLELVGKHFDVVECKKTDATTVKIKNEGWQQIACEFNSISSIHFRDWITLKNCWENLKKRAKHEITHRNQHLLGKGGGPPKRNTEDPTKERVLDLIQRRVIGLNNCVDSDGTRILDSGSNTLSQDMVQPDTNINGSQTNDSNNSKPIETTLGTLLLPKAYTHAEEEHRVQMNILRLQEQKEKEILEQEKLKTAQEKLRLEILELQLRKLKD